MSNANNVSSTEARHQSTAPGEVHGRLRLMDCPGVVDTPRTRSGHRELRLFDAVGHLEHHTQRGTRHQPGDPVVEQDDANGVEPQWNPECQRAEPETVTLSVSPACARGQLAITEIADLRPDARQQHDLYIPDGWRRIPLEPGREPMTVDVDPHQEPPAEALDALEHSVLDGEIAWSCGGNPLRRPDRGSPCLSSRSFTGPSWPDPDSTVQAGVKAPRTVY